MRKNRVRYAHVKTSNLKLKLLELLSSSPDGIPQPHLAKALGISKSYLSQLLKDLERQGIVYRVRLGNIYVVKRALPKDTADMAGRTLRLGIVWSSEYLFLGHFAKMLRDREGYELKIYVHPNAIQAVLALINGKVDGVLSPLITQIYGYIISKGFVIAGGGGRGGGYVYEIPGSTADTVISSELSTMDFCRFIAMKRRYIDSTSTRYFTSAEEAIALVRRRSARYTVVWHPINLSIELLGGRKLFCCLDFEEIHYCCTLALSKSLGVEVIDRVSRVYREAIEAFNKDRERFIEWYSALVGIDLPMVKKALTEYEYDPELDVKKFSRVLEVLGVDVPSISSIHQALHVQP